MFVHNRPMDVDKDGLTDYMLIRIMLKVGQHSQHKSATARKSTSPLLTN